MCASAFLAIGDLRLRVADYAKTVNGLRQDLIECQARYRECSMENAKLRGLVIANQICHDDAVDSRECPMYDKHEPYNCRRERTLRELGIEGE